METLELANPAAARPVKPVRRRDLFAGFLRLGFTAFGGPAMLAYMRDFAVKKKWLSGESFQEGLALCQSIPGATGMQAAAYVGLRARSFGGAVAAYVAFTLPAFLLMIGLSVAYEGARDLQTVTSVFRGLQVIVVALVANATLTFGKTSLKTWWDGLLAAAAAAVLLAGANPILVVVGAGALGLGLYRGWAREQSSAPRGAAPAPGARRAGTRIALLLAAGTLAALGALFLLDRRLFELAALMLRVDFFAFGGGFGSLPILLHEVVEVRHWLDATTFLDGIALGQVTPGPIVITATFIGHQIAGLAGAAVGTVAIFLPSLVILVAAVPHLDAVRHRPFFRKTLRGILSAFVGLLFSVTLRFAWSAPWSLPAAGLALVALLALRRGTDILWVVLGGTAILAALL